MPTPPAVADPDSGFTLDEALLARRKAVAAQRMATVQIPALRVCGFAVLCTLAGFFALKWGGPFPTPALVGLWVLNLGYGALSWVTLRALHGRVQRLDLSLLFFHADLLIWLVNLAYLESGRDQLFFACLLLARVVDQTGFGVRRALYFAHVIVAAYLVYAGLVELIAPARATAGERFGIAIVLYVVGLYIAAVGVVPERLRRRTREAMHAARTLVADLERQNVALQQQARELDQARAAAEQASVAKSQFLAVTSHEIRTPMNGILGATELLRGTSLSGDQQRYVRIAHRSATALLALIDDVLDLSRIEAGRLELHPAPVDLAALVNDAVELVRLAARGKPIAVGGEVDRRLPSHIHADPGRLRQLLVNLLHNAVKFTDRGSVRLRIEGGRTDAGAPALRLAVRDTGIGIPAEQLATIFDAFTQVDSSSTRRHGGSGLGLAIVREIVARMGGTIAVDSHVGQGSQFLVVLPLEEAVDPESGPDADDLPELDDHAPIRVLLAEDDPVNQLVIAGMLEQMGCEVETVGDGAAAHSAAVRGGHDIVFMDCRMPVMDGWDAARQIRAAENGGGRRRLAIVALTADALASDRERALAAGMDDFLSKPVSSAQLAMTIAMWTGRRTAFPATQW